MSRFVPSALATLSAVALLSAPAAHAKDFSGVLNWIPAEVSTLIAIDLAGSRKTPFFKSVEKSIIDLTGYGRDIAHMKRDGLDVMATVKTIVYAGPDEIIRKAKQSLVILEGDFDEAKIKAYYEKKSKTPLTDKTHALGGYYQIGDDFCVIVNGGFAMFGDKPLFEKALAARHANEGGKKAKANSLVQRFKSFKHGFGVIAGSSTLKRLLGKDFGDVQDVRGAGMGFDFSAGFGLEIVGVFPNAAKATSVASSISSDLAEFASDPELKEIGLEEPLARVSTATSGSEVKIALALDKKGAADFAKSLKDLL